MTVSFARAEVHLIAVACACGGSVAACGQRVGALAPAAECAAGRGVPAVALQKEAAAVALLVGLCIARAREHA